VTPGSEAVPLAPQPLPPSRATESLLPGGRPAPPRGVIFPLVGYVLGSRARSDQNCSIPRTMSRKLSSVPGLTT
jgi:hypothetical protein